MALEVEEVAGRAAFRRFVELPHVLFRGEPRWSAPLAAWDRSRLDPHRNRFFDAGDGAYLLLRRRGRPAGRVTAHVAADGDEQGWFGFYDVDDDPDAAGALLEAAAGWLRDRGCTSMTGPVSFTVAEDAGVLVEGFDAPGTTGRWWHPPWYAGGMRAAGLEEVAGSRRPSWRVPTGACTAAGFEPGGDVPALIGPYADRRIVAEAVAAVPDLASAGGSTWDLARRAKRGDWQGCTVVRCDGDPAVLVPPLVAAAAAAAYAWVVAPWSPDVAAPPEAIHALFSTAL